MSHKPANCFDQVAFLKICRAQTTKQENQETSYTAVFKTHVYVAQYMLIFLCFLRIHLYYCHIVPVCNKTGRDM